MDKLNLPVGVFPDPNPRRMSLLQYDKWVNDNLRALRDPERQRRLGAQTSRRPVTARFRIV